MIEKTYQELIKESKRLTAKVNDKNKQNEKKLNES